MHGDRFLWIDAICINQSRLEEKNVQVNLMREIYAKVILTTALLSPLWDGIDLAVSFIQHMASEAVFDTALNIQYEEGVPSQQTKDQLMQTLNIPVEDSLDCDGFIRFLRNPWFQRAWVFQEVVVLENSIIHCGSVCNEKHFRFIILVRSCLAVSALGNIKSEFHGPVSRMAHIGHVLAEKVNTRDAMQFNESSGTPTEPLSLRRFRSKRQGICASGSCEGRN